MEGSSRPEDGRTDFNGDVQILRAIAALLVIVAHSGLILFPGPRHGGFLPTLLGDLGNIGVAIFFAISGYIMMQVNATAFHRPAVPLKFFIHRLLRVAPVYWLATLAAYLTLTGLASKAIPAKFLLLSFIFVPFYSNIEAPGFFPVLGVGWTLNMEMMFYLLFAGALVFRRRTGLTLLTVALLGLDAYGLLLRPAQSAALRTSALAFYSDDVVALFAVGVLIRWRQDVVGAFMSRFDGRFSALLFPASLAAPVAAALVLEPLRLPATHRLLQCLSALSLIVAVTSGAWRRSRLDRALLFLGDASYSLYLFHSLILLYLAALWRALALQPSILLFVVNCAVSVGGSTVCHLFIERPVRTRLERPLRRWVDRRIRSGPPVPGGRGLS